MMDAWEKTSQDLGALIQRKLDLSGLPDSFPVAAVVSMCHPEEHFPAAHRSYLVAPVNGTLVLLQQADAEPVEYGEVAVGSEIDPHDERESCDAVAAAKAECVC